MVSAAALALWPATAGAAETPWVDLQDVRVRLIAAQDAVGPDGEAELGLQVRLAPGWKTYWREPGESGLPPRFDWSGSENVAAVTVAWPAPMRFESFGFTSLGYAGEVVLPLRLQAAVPGRPVSARLALDLMACRDICVPYRAEMALDLPARAPVTTPHAATIAAYRQRVPVAPDESGLRIEAVGVKGRELRVEARAAAPFRSPDLLVEANGGVGFGPPRVEIGAESRRALLRLPLAEGVQGLAGEIVLTLIDDGRAVEQTWRLPDH